MIAAFKVGADFVKIFPAEPVGGDLTQFFVHFGV